MTLHSHIIRDRDGKFASHTDLGSYPIYHVCADGGVLCAKCANDPSNPIQVGKPHASMGRSPDAQWTIVDSAINWEESDLRCDHCYKSIEPAYSA